MKTLSLIIYLYLYSMVSYGQEVKEYTLWTEGVRGDNGLTGKETVDAEGRVRNISVPRLYVYSPDKKNNTGKAVVICPGGGYGLLAMKHEGEMFARWLAERGITGIILKYRLPNFHHEIPLMDANRAMRLVRSKAEKWGIKPDKIGIAGFSAGGHLASTAGTHFDTGNPVAEDEVERFSCRPDFMVLFYPVISFQRSGIVHIGSRNALLGENQSQQLLDYYSPEKQVTDQTPPTFLVHCDDDPAVSPLNSILFYELLKDKRIPAVLYVFGEGGHGWGLRENFGYYQQWTMLLERWLKQL